MATTSGLYEFDPSAGELILNAFGRIGVRPSELTQSHMYQARLSANFILTEISNVQPNLWSVDLQCVPLIQGSATYAIPAEIVMILDAYISYSSPTIDRYIPAISRTEYASYPNKTQQGFPTVFWFDRLISPTFTLWPVPDGNGPYTLKYYSVRQNQDVVTANAQTVEVPYRWMDTFVSGLAWKLSELYAPEREAFMLQKYERSHRIAMTQDVEDVPLYIVPGLASYWDRG